MSGALCASISVGAADAAQPSLEALAGTPLQRTSTVVLALGSGSSAALQPAYETARDLQEDVRRASRNPRACAALATALSSAAETLVAVPEAIDQLDSRGTRRAKSSISAKLRAVDAAVRSCRSDGSGSSSLPVVPMQPSSGQAFFGTIVAAAPPGARYVVVTVNGRRWREQRVTGRVVRLAATGNSQAYAFRLVFRDATGTDMAIARADGAWLLPATAKVAAPGRRSDPASERRLARLAQSFSGTSAMWIQDLASGRYAGLNAGARFPAASLVKLGLLAGAVPRLGPRPEQSPYFRDLQAISGWSSNLAANRLVAGLGSGCGSSRDALANDGLRRLGAKGSTFTGCYIPGTELQPGLPDAPATAPPPLDTSRYTTAQDLGRMMYALQASAVGRPRARQETGLSPPQARLVLGLLLRSEQRLDNRSLFSGGLPRGTALAQKNGWLRRARGGTAIAYVSSGPMIMSLLATRQSGVSLGEVQALGSRQAAIAADMGRG